MSFYFLQRECHRIFVLSTFKIKEGATGEKGVLLFFFFLYSNRMKLPLPFLLWNSHFVVHSVKEMLDLRLPGLHPIISGFQRSRSQHRMFLLTAAGFFLSSSTLVAWCWLLPGTGYCTRQTCLEPAGHFC